MTREEAIEKLEAFAPMVVDDTREALDMAIEALDERKVELFDDGTLVVNVKEGEKVGRVLIDGDDHFGGLYYIDAEPVLHCKDCRWYDKGYGFVCHNPRYGDGYANYPPPYVDEDYWCKDGEHKGGDTE